MKPNKDFSELSPIFWATVRLLSERVGYTQKGTGRIKIPSAEEMHDALLALNLSPNFLSAEKGSLTEFGTQVQSYFQFRADCLEKVAKPNLMNGAEAKKLFLELKKKHKPKCPIPLNKQSGSKKAPAFFTGIINILIEAHCGACPIDYDPRRLTSFTKDGVPVRTLSRRVDGAFPSAINPIAIWEIKEYYYTTTFGSRIADGVYESYLDGFELQEARVNAEIDCKHYLFVDAYVTWWEMGRSYLCRICDMLHMGMVDEVFFGREVVVELPRVVKSWVKKLNQAPQT